MNEVMKPLERCTWQLSALALAFGIGTFAVPAANAAAGGSPCDIRDTCSADPARYAVLRDDANIKAREYVGEMRWGTGGAPDDVYVISKTVKSRDLAGAKPCEVRDVCDVGEASWRVVRNGPSTHDLPPLARDDGVSVANKPAQK